MFTCTRCFEMLFSPIAKLVAHGSEQFVVLPKDPSRPCSTHIEHVVDVDNELAGIRLPSSFTTAAN